MSRARDSMPRIESAFLAAVNDLIGKGSVTAIFVTHGREEIPRAIHRVMRLRKGEISQLRSGRFGNLAAQVLGQQT